MKKLSVFKQYALAIFLTLYVIFALCYLWATPNFEAPDELQHMGVVQYIATYAQLPVMNPAQDSMYRQQAGQPPFYYVLAALLVAPIDRSDYAQVTLINPHANVGVPALNGNKNSVLHDHPTLLHGTTLAAYIVRLLSIVCGVVTVMAVYRSAQLVAPHKPHVILMATAFTAFNPQFLFISSVINNDNMVMMMASLTMWQTLKLLRDGFTARHSLILALLVALACLSKVSGLMMIPLVGVTALYVAYRDRNLRGLMVLTVLAASCWLLIAAWWFVRNLTLYRDFLGVQTMLDYFGHRSFDSIGEWLAAVWSEMGSLRYSFWGVFGWFNIQANGAYYTLMDIVTVIAVVGVIVYLWRNRHQRERLAPALVIVLMFSLGLIAYLNYSSQTQGAQGRYFLPYTAAISTLLALGLTTFRLPAWGIYAPLGVFAFMTPFITIHPQYAPPPIVSALPTNAAPLNMRFGDIRLVGYEAPDARYAPGDSLPITLYWQPEAHTEGDFSLSLKAMTNDGTLVGHIDTFPGWGSVRTSTWQTGVIYADHYLLPLNVDARGCSPLRVEVRWWRYPHGIYLPTEVNGEAEDAVFLPVGVFNDGSLLPPLENLNEVHPVDFDNTFRLLGYQVRETSLTLLWETLRIPQADDTVFVQMLNGNTIVAQGDAPPPIPTRYLIVGERFATQHYLNVPPNQGDYPLYIGWYNETQRLPTNSPDYAYPLFSVRFSLTQP